MLCQSIDFFARKKILERSTKQEIMKSVIILLGLSALLFTVNAYPSDKLSVLKAQIRSLTAEVERIKRQLEIEKEIAEDNVYDKAQSIANKEQDAFRDYKRELISGIRKDIKDSESKGNLVGDCFETATDDIRTSEDLASDVADKCVQTAGKNTKNNLGFIDNLISVADTSTGELRNVILECHDSDDVRMESCIMSRLAELTTYVKKLEKDAVSIRITIEPIINNIVMQATKCIEKVYEIVYITSEGIKLGIPKCIEENQENQETSLATTSSSAETTSLSTSSTTSKKIRSYDDDEDVY